MRPAFAASAAAHLALVLLLSWLGAARHIASAPAAKPPDVFPADLVWLQQSGPGGGGGGGGDHHAAPPRQAAAVGRDVRTVRAKPSARPAQPPHLEQPIQPEALNLPVLTLASALDSFPGAIEAPPVPASSLGPGGGGGAGTGKGPGDGSGTGPGLGPGFGGGTGGDAYRPGSGVTTPIEVKRGTPRYTADAMRARVQGIVLVECIVATNGECTRIRVARGMEPSFGLNEEAVKAAQEWRFRPGTRRGEPVPVLITMEITFTLR